MWIRERGFTGSALSDLTAYTDFHAKDILVGHVTTPTGYKLPVIHREAAWATAAQSVAKPGWKQLPCCFSEPMSKSLRITEMLSVVTSGSPVRVSIWSTQRETAWGSLTSHWTTWTWGHRSGSDQFRSEQTGSDKFRLVLVLVDHLVSSLAADLLGRLLQNVQLPVQTQTASQHLLVTYNRIPPFWIFWGAKSVSAVFVSFCQFSVDNRLI